MGLGSPCDNSFSTIHQKNSRDQPNDTWCLMGWRLFITPTKGKIFRDVYKSITSNKGKTFCDVYKYITPTKGIIFCDVYKYIKPTKVTIFWDVYKYLKPPKGRIFGDVYKLIFQRSTKNGQTWGTVLN